jgi:hypothetical protein
MIDVDVINKVKKLSKDLQLNYLAYLETLSRNQVEQGQPLKVLETGCPIS